MLGTYARWRHPHSEVEALAANWVNVYSKMKVGVAYCGLHVGWTC